MLVCVCVRVHTKRTVFLFIDLRDGFRDNAAEGYGGGCWGVSGVTHVMRNLLDILQRLLSLFLLQRRHHLLICPPSLLRQRHQPVKQGLKFTGKKKRLMYWSLYIIINCAIYLMSVCVCVSIYTCVCTNVCVYIYVPLLPSSWKFPQRWLGPVCWHSGPELYGPKQKQMEFPAPVP